jgi:TusA-related sulfurtransferase
VRALPAGGILCLGNTVEPLPLYTLLGRRGFQAWARRLAADDWEIFFAQVAPAAAQTSAEAADATPARTITLDNRGLEPPQPMLRVLAALDTSGPNDTIVALTDRVPLLLFDELNERGLAYTAKQQPDGAHRVTIAKGAAHAPHEARSLE